MNNKKTSVDTVVGTLIERIQGGRYAPGNRLPSERRLQEELGVGRLALREALNRLNALGIINTSQGKGTFVQKQLQSRTLKNILIPQCALADSSRLKELVEARVMVEGEIAAMAARQRTAQDLHRLEKILDQPVDLTTPHELIAYLDLQFHQEMALIIDNHFLVLMHEALLSHIRIFLNAFVKNKANPAEILSAHRPILEAISNRESEDARSLVRLHISHSRKDYERFIAQNHGQDYPLQNLDGGSP